MMLSLADCTPLPAVDSEVEGIVSLVERSRQIGSIEDERSNALSKKLPCRHRTTQGTRARNGDLTYLCDMTPAE